MGAEHRTRVFKSGNSLALRLPRAMGLSEGDEVDIVPHADGGFTFWRVDQRLEVFMRLYGSMSPGFMAAGRDDLEQGERDWSQHGSSSAAAA